MANKDKPYQQGNIETTGKLITAVDPTQLGKGDFQLLSNMRYTDRGIRSIKGMTKVNTAATTKPYITNMHHFINSFGESHVLAQSKSSLADTSPVLLDNTTAIGTQGNFTSLFSETSGAGTGTFTNAPDGTVVYANGKDLLIWGGNESRCAGFTVADTDGITALPAVFYDYLSEVTDSSSTNTAIIKQRYVHIASTRKLKGVKFYVSVSNPNACIPVVKYWSGTAWTAVSNMNDGTSVGGVTLAQTGEITFDSTVSVAQQRYFNNTVLYWYLFDFNGVANTTAVSKCTVDAPIQSISNIWNGEATPITSFQVYDGTKYLDYSAQTFKQDYVSGASTTYYNMNAFTTLQNLAIGFASRMMGIRFKLAPSVSGTATAGNSFAANMVVKYWNGASWVALTAYDDTAIGGKSLNRSGEVTWLPPDSSLEFKNAITSKDRFYYYQVSFSANLSSGGIFLDSIEGIPAPKSMDTFKVPVVFQGRLGLANNVGDKENSMLLSAVDTNSVFNGSDSSTIYFGDDGPIVAATPFYSRFSNDFFETLLACKADSVWVVDGTTIGEPNAGGYVVRKVSSVNGCSAPHTLTVCDVGVTGGTGTAKGTARHAVVWQSSNGIILWDGSTLFPISEDIRDVFDQTKSYAIEPTMINASYGFFDEAFSEYHWLWASKGTTTHLNMESVFDLIGKRWYTIDRGTGNYLLSGCSVMDVNNNRYLYGATYNGYAETLDTGTTFDGTPITSAWQTGDIPLGGWLTETLVRKVKPIMRAKNTTANNMTLTHYIDTNTTPSSTLTFSVGSASGRIAKPSVPVQSISTDPAIFHSFKCSMTTSDEAICFEPIGLGIVYKVVREELI